MDISVSSTLAAASSPHCLVLVVLVVLDAAAQPREPSWGLRSAVVAVTYDHCQPLGIAISRRSIFLCCCFAHPPRPRATSGKVGTVAKGSAPYRTEGGSAGSTWRILTLVGSR